MVSMPTRPGAGRCGGHHGQEAQQVQLLDLDGSHNLEGDDPMNSVSHGEWWDEEPTDADLMAIETEWPAIEAELVLLDAQYPPVPAVTGPVTVRRVRRTRRRVLAASTSRAGVTQ